MRLYCVLLRKSCATDLTCLEQPDDEFGCGLQPVKIINYNEYEPNNDAALIITQGSCQTSSDSVCLGKTPPSVHFLPVYYKDMKMIKSIGNLSIKSVTSQF